MADGGNCGTAAELNLAVQAPQGAVFCRPVRPSPCRCRAYGSEQPGLRPREASLVRSSLHMSTTAIGCGGRAARAVPAAHKKPTTAGRLCAVRL